MASEQSMQKNGTVKSMHAGKKSVANAIIYDASEAATSYNTNTKKRVKSSTKKAQKSGEQKKNRLVSAHQLGD